MSTIILTGGGTAGHVVPNIALLPELKKHFNKIVYIGSASGIEARLLKQHKEIEFHSVETVKFARKKVFKNLLIPFKLLKGRQQAKKLLAALSPTVVFSKGGFVSVPVVLAARALGIPVVSHESDLTLGLANKITKNKAKVICTSFAKTAEQLKNGLYTGSPVRQEIFSGTRVNGLKEFGLSSQLPVVLVLGGSLGSSAINNTITACLPKLLSKCQILHSCGSGNIKHSIKHTHYKAVEYIDNMADALAVADIVITRGGSNAIFEILALKKPMLIIPLPKGNSRGDQVENAKVFQQKGWARVIQQADLNKQNLLSEIELLLKTKAETTKKLSNIKLPNSNMKIVETILKHC